MQNVADRQLILREAQRLVGRPLRELVDVRDERTQGRLTRGSVGHLYEDHFGLPRNNDAAPDFAAAGVELKSVPLKKQKSLLVAKERTFITVIDYTTIADVPFEGSPLDLKTRATLYVFYEHDRETPVGDFVTRGVLLHERDELDEMMLREAYETVRRAVREGRAHEISEGDTWGVGAATKDSKARDVPQPFGTEPARRRAFAWKPAYTTRLWQAAKPRTTAGLPALSAPPRTADLQQEVLALVEPWYGTSVDELRRRFAPKLSDTYKSLTSHVSRLLLGSSSGRELEKFERLGVTVRTMRVRTEDLRPFEAVSFPAFDPVELAAEEWESSTLLNDVTSMFFVVFAGERSRPIPSSRLIDAFFWHPTDAQLASIKREWEHYRELIASSRVDHLPTQADTDVIHVRPHGRDAKDTLPLPNGVPWQRSSFWLNQDFLQRLVRGDLRP